MKTLIAHWESRGKAHYLKLYRTEGGGYCYESTNGGGTLGPHDSDDAAIVRMSWRLDDFQPDRNTSPMRRIA